MAIGAIRGGAGTVEGDLMHSVSDLYLTLLADRNHRVETKLSIAEVEYSQGDIVKNSLRVYGGLYSTFGIGNCSARQIDVEFYPKDAIPRQAKIEVFARLVLGEQVSEWIPKGVFFFSTRKTDRVTGVLSVHGYDAMLKAEETWLDSSYDAETWPMPAATAVADIAVAWAWQWIAARYWMRRFRCSTP